MNEREILHAELLKCVALFVARNFSMYDDGKRVYISQIVVIFLSCLEYCKFSKKDLITALFYAIKRIYEM
jgi:hypothetical protein